MKVIRKQTIDTEVFELGDEIRFTLTTGEKVRAKAVQKCDKGTLFITKDCVRKQMPMYKDVSDEHRDYEHSDLRKYLNNELLSLFPERIRSRMIPMPICDYLRIPTEKEIFNENTFGEGESYTKRFHGMKHRRNRIAFGHTGSKDAWWWYWLENRVPYDDFAEVDYNGNANYGCATRSAGVRVVFELRNGEVNEV